MMEGAGVALLFTFLCCVFVDGCSSRRSQEAVYRQAIEAGAAVRVVDQQTGEVSIKFGCPCQEKTNE